jgi:hypothetical protein
MSATAGLLGLLLLGAPVRALDARSAAFPDPESGDFPALTLSWGPGRPVCARATFDPVKAAVGGWTFVVDAGIPGDEDAIRLSEAVLARAGGLASPAAILARRHGVPAVSLGRGVWDASGPTLALEETTFGAPVVEDGVALRAAGPPRELVLREGDVVCVDAAAGRVVLPPPQEAEARLAAAEAARAYDGLRDEVSLERWTTGAPDAARAAFLMAELASRALEGGVSVEDLTKLDRAARSAAGAASAQVARAEARAWARALLDARDELAACPAQAADAPAADVLDRLSSGARAVAARASAAGRALGLGDGGLPALARACAAAASKRRSAVPATAPTLDEVARAAGAQRPQAFELGPEAWRAFIADNRLADFLADTSGDSSLALRGRSARIRARLMSARLDASSQAGRLIAAAAGSGACVVTGPDASVPAADARAAPAAARAVWAASWDPGPLGARLRAGHGSEIDGRLRFERTSTADVSGLLFSRDPASGGRGRVFVEAASGGADSLLSGTAATQRYALDSASGRALQAPASGALLSPERLKRVARLSRSLDAWQGGGVEAAFSFVGTKLLILHARPIAPPAPPQPLSDLLTPPPSTQNLDIKAVR